MKRLSAHSLLHFLFVAFAVFWTEQPPQAVFLFAAHNAPDIQCVWHKYLIAQWLHFVCPTACCPTAKFVQLHNR